MQCFNCGRSFVGFESNDACPECKEWFKYKADHMTEQDQIAKAISDIITGLSVLVAKAFPLAVSAVLIGAILYVAIWFNGLLGISGWFAIVWIVLLVSVVYWIVRGIYKRREARKQ